MHLHGLLASLTELISAPVITPMTYACQQVTAQLCSRATAGPHSSLATCPADTGGADGSDEKFIGLAVSGSYRHAATSCCPDPKTGAENGRQLLQLLLTLVLRILPDRNIVQPKHLTPEIRCMVAMPLPQPKPETEKKNQFPSPAWGVVAVVEDSKGWLIGAGADSGTA